MSLIIFLFKSFRWGFTNNFSIYIFLLWGFPNICFFLYLSGGVSLIDGMTDGKYSNNFIGCIGNIVIQGKGPLELPQDAVQGFNVHNCEI